MFIDESSCNSVILPNSLRSAVGFLACTETVVYDFIAAIVLPERFSLLEMIVLFSKKILWLGHPELPDY